MKRYILFFIVVPLAIAGVMVTMGQISVADSQLEVAPMNWPSNTPKHFQTTPDTASLSIEKFASPDPATVGAPLTYTIAITNAGGLDATGVVVADALPLSVDFASASPSQGNCTLVIFVVICDMNTIASLFTATITIVVTPTQAGPIINTVAVTSTNVPDPDSTNNEFTLQTQVGPAGAVGTSIYLPVVLK